MYEHHMYVHTHPVAVKGQKSLTPFLAAEFNEKKSPGHLPGRYQEQMSTRC